MTSDQARTYAYPGAEPIATAEISRSDVFATCTLFDYETGLVLKRVRAALSTMRGRRVEDYLAARAIGWARHTYGGEPVIDRYAPTGGRYAGGAFLLLRAVA